MGKKLHTARIRKTTNSNFSHLNFGCFSFLLLWSSNMEIIMVLSAQVWGIPFLTDFFFWEYVCCATFDLFILCGAVNVCVCLFLFLFCVTLEKERCAFIAVSLSANRFFTYPREHATEERKKLRSKTIYVLAELLFFFVCNCCCCCYCWYCRRRRRRCCRRLLVCAFLSLFWSFTLAHTLTLTPYSRKKLFRLFRFDAFQWWIYLDFFFSLPQTLSFVSLYMNVYVRVCVILYGDLLR